MPKSTRAGISAGRGRVASRQAGPASRLVVAGDLASGRTLAGLPLALVACAASIALVTGACTAAGGSGRRQAPATTGTALTVPPAATTTEQPQVVAVVNAALDDYTIRVTRNPVRADHLTIRVVNADSVPHNLTLIATRRPPEPLPTSGIRVDVSNPAIRVLAATPMLRPSRSDSLTAVVHPGRYILVCTVPHHYVRSHMVATLTVK
jgi:uncharacterized cupredoxin-like copper-binding protein